MNTTGLKYQRKIKFMSNSVFHTIGELKLQGRVLFKIFSTFQVSELEVQLVCECGLYAGVYAIMHSINLPHCRGGGDNLKTARFIYPPGLTLNTYLFPKLLSFSLQM